MNIHEQLSHALIQGEIFRAITAEREYQDRKHAGKTCRDGLPDSIKHAVLSEEVGEVAKEVCDGFARGQLDKEKLRKELVQVAAVAVAWLEALSE